MSADRDSVRVRITPEYPGLVISDDGRIQGPSGKWLKPWIASHGYPMIWLSGGRTETVHTVVCTAFHGPKPSRVHQVAHGNGVSTDNRSINLRWATQVENEADKIFHGRVVHGQDHWTTKITENDVLEIRRLASEGATQRSLAPVYGVAWQTIGRIIRRETWGWLE